ncbi:hypothetical protein TIFTF001_023204 [Ficus carica]|uniref:Phytocyanin domain-containing protein n=1 Tax=Ficus carica TaxID=3494 RepID=A0AA88AUD3_FICCA|nr:hypothetical protein TIFTF001_023204 [Ficus carica]
MASNRFVILGIAVILLPTIAMATEYIVGDDKGWNIGVDYQAWAKDKMFNVGDSLVFQYDASKHNVVKVNGTAFKDCLAPPDAGLLTSGNDTIVLQTAGNKWYLCGKVGHCAKGQKLSISVMDMSAPQPSPSSAARGIVFSGSFQLLASAFVLLKAFV